MRYILFLTALFVFTSCNTKVKSESKEVTKNPNIVILYADDLGFGDLSCYGATELSTPNIDRIAKNGIRFTKGYAASPTCTPSRYALLTGNYPFRKKSARVLNGNAPLLFGVQEQTLPKMLKTQGYITGAVGKWHLGFGKANEDLDWNKKISPGPLEIGFDYAFLMASTNDRVPSVYVQNHHIVGLLDNDPIAVSYTTNFDGEPTGKENPELLKMHPSHGHDMSIHNGISRIGFQKGGKNALFVDENMGDDFLKESLSFVEKYKDTTFFLYYGFHQPHVPRVPHPRFVGKSGLGPRGDAIVEMDWAVGQFLNYLEEKGLAENTIVIFTSDNGPVLDDGYQDQAVEKNGAHQPTGGLRGGKYSLFDAGTHVPFLLQWKGNVQQRVSNALVSQIDFLASFANLTNGENLSHDSENIIDAFLGKSDQGRTSIVLGRENGVAYYKDRWAYIPPHKGPKMTNKFVNIETGRDTLPQLYDLSQDATQQENIAKQHPEKVIELSKELELVMKSNESY